MSRGSSPIAFARLSSRFIFTSLPSRMAWLRLLRFTPGGTRQLLQRDVVVDAPMGDLVGVQHVLRTHGFTTVLPHCGQKFQTPLTW